MQFVVCSAALCPVKQSLHAPAFAASMRHSPAKQAPWPHHVKCRWFQPEVIQHADYVTSTEQVDLADHESFFWT